MNQNKTFSPQIMFPIIKEYVSGNVSRKEFCHQKEIKPHILQYWLKKYNTTQRKDPVSTFTPIQIKDTQESLTDRCDQDATDRHIVIRTRTGLEIQIPV